MIDSLDFTDTTDPRSCFLVDHLPQTIEDVAPDKKVRWFTRVTSHLMYDGGGAGPTLMVDTEDNIVALYPSERPVNVPWVEYPDRECPAIHERTAVLLVTSVVIQGVEEVANEDSLRTRAFSKFSDLQDGEARAFILRIRHKDGGKYYAIAALEYAGVMALHPDEKHVGLMVRSDNVFGLLVQGEPPEGLAVDPV